MQNAAIRVNDVLTHPPCSCFRYAPARCNSALEIFLLSYYLLPFHFSYKLTPNPDILNEPGSECYCAEIAPEVTRRQSIASIASFPAVKLAVRVPTHLASQRYRKWLCHKYSAVWTQMALCL